MLRKSRLLELSMTSPGAELRSPQMRLRADRKRGLARRVVKDLDVHVEILLVRLADGPHFRA